VSWVVLGLVAALVVGAAARFAMRW
jgi:hypothetical protein